MQTYALVYRGIAQKKERLNCEKGRITFYKRKYIENHAKPDYN